MSTEKIIQILDVFLLNQAILHFIWDLRNDRLSVWSWRCLQINRTLADPITDILKDSTTKAKRGEEKEFCYRKFWEV